jgi:hypothetical protein
MQDDDENRFVMMSVADKQRHSIEAFLSGATAVALIWLISANWHDFNNLLVSPKFWGMVIALGLLQAFSAVRRRSRRR